MWGKKRVLSAVAVLLVALVSPLLGPTSVSAGQYFYASMSLSPDVIHVVPGKTYASFLTGYVDTFPAAPCNGDCTVRWRIYAPGSATPWYGYIGTAPADDDWNDLRLKFPVASGDSSIDGEHDVRVELYDSTGTLLESTSVATLKVYSELNPTAHIQRNVHEVLEGRQHRLEVSVVESWNDGTYRSYRGERLNAQFQSSIDGVAWENRYRTPVNPDTNSAEFWFRGQETLQWRVRLTNRQTGAFAMMTPAKTVTVWQETNEFDIRRSSFTPESIYQYESVLLEARVLAKYTDGEWHAPNSMYQVQFQKRGEEEWTRIDRSYFRGDSTRLRIEPKASGRLRMKVGPVTSASERVIVKPLDLERLRVTNRSKGCFTGERVCYWTVKAVSNTGNGMPKVRLQFQRVGCARDPGGYHCTPKGDWRNPTILDAGRTSYGGEIRLRMRPPRTGCLRVWAPKYDMGTSRRYCYVRWLS